MKKKIILAIIVFSTLIACGKKGDPEYKESKNKVLIKDFFTIII